jgi:hypothetical protein
MIAGTLIAFAIALGYLVAVGLSMMATFGITKSAPGFVAKDLRLRTRYKLVQQMLWLVCVTVGASLSAVVSEPVLHPWLVGTLLAVILVAVPWTNTWETRQRGLGQQLLMSLVSVAGVAAGYYLVMG